MYEEFERAFFRRVGREMGREMEREVGWVSGGWSK